MTPRTLPFCLSLCLALPLPALAQTLLSGDHSIDGRLCAGPACTGTESFGALPFNSTLKLKDNGPRLLFEDSNGASPNNWALQTNDVLSPTNYFSIQDGQTGRDLLRLEAGAPDNAIYLDSSGQLGLGTSIPQAALHIETSTTGGLRINQTNTSAGPPQAWEAAVSTGGDFAILNATGLRAPFGVVQEAPQNALLIGENDVRVNSLDGDFDFAVGSDPISSALFVDGTTGNLGIGTDTPLAAQHILRRDGGTAVNLSTGLLIETVGAQAPRGLLTLRNEGQVFFALEDTSIPRGDNSGRVWNFQNLGGEFRVTTAPGGGADIEMRLDTAGNMRIEGNYFANSFTQMDVPDYVFAPDYDLKPLSEVQAFISEHSHLPGIPSAAEINAQGLNMTDMQMRLLQKVEELTLYTLALEEARADQALTLAEQAADKARMRSEIAWLKARMDKMETAHDRR